MTMQYHHAYDFAFEVVSNDPEAEDVTPAMIRAAMLDRVNRLSDDDLMRACSCYDTYEMGA